MNELSSRQLEEIGANAALIAVLAPICILVKAFVFQVLAWNLGVVGLADALGGNVGDISFGTAFGAVFLVWTLKGIFSRGNTLVTEAFNAAK